MAIKSASVTLTSVGQNTVYALKINETTVSVTAGGSDTPTSIMAALAAAINSSAPLQPFCQASASSGTLTITENAPDTLNSVTDVSTYYAVGSILIGGTPTSGKVLTCVLNGHSVSYTTQSGDTTSALEMAGLEAAVVADSTDTGLVNVASSGASLILIAKLPNTTYSLTSAAGSPVTSTVTAFAFSQFAISASGGALSDTLPPNVGYQPLDPMSYADLSATTKRPTTSAPATGSLPFGSTTGIIGQPPTFNGTVEVIPCGVAVQQPGANPQRIVYGGVDVGSEP